MSINDEKIIHELDILMTNWHHMSSEKKIIFEDRFYTICRLINIDPYNYPIVIDPSSDRERFLIYCQNILGLSVEE